MNSLLPVTVLGMVVAGLAGSVLGTVKLSLARKLQLADDRIGLLATSLSAPFLPVVLTTGWFVDALGPRIILIAAAVGIAVGLGFFAAARTFVSALVSGFLFALCFAMLINVVHVLIPLAFTLPIALATNLADSCFGVGALATPLLAAAIFPRYGMERLLHLIALTALTVAVVALLSADAQQVSGAHNVVASPSTGAADLLSHPLIWLCGLCLATFGPVESAFSTWTTSYLVEKKFDAGFATRMLSGFWSASILGRLATALLLPAGWEGRLLTGSATIGLAVLVGVVFSRPRWLAPLLVISAGVVLGPVFPTVIAVVFESFATEAHGRAVGMTMAIGSVGYSLSPVVVGYFAKRTSIQRSFAILLVPAVLFLLLTLVLNQSV